MNGPAWTSSVRGRLAPTVKPSIPSTVTCTVRWPATPAGVAGHLTVHVTVLGIDGFTVGASLPRTLDVQAGPFIRVQIGDHLHPLSLEVAGQSLHGIFSFESVTEAGVDGKLN